MLKRIISLTCSPMTKFRLKIALDLRRTIFIAGLFAVAGLSLLTKSAEMQSEVNLSDQSLFLGKLAYEKRVFAFLSAFDIVNTANSDGSGEIALTQFPPSAVEPAWSPDGTRIAYVVKNSSSDIYVMNADGSNKTFLTGTFIENERNPTWSATGTIAYERDGQIWAMNANGTNQALFSGIAQPSPAFPAWSADGSKLAFTSGGEVWVIEANGTNERRVTMNATTDADPAWSPDGTKIIFTKGSTGIGMINLDGTNETNLTIGTDDRQPSWSNDSTKIAFVRRGTSVDGIYVMDINGANQIRIIADVQMTPGSQNANPVWQPIRSPQRAQFDFDGDGRSDISVFRPSDGVWYLLRSQAGFSALQFGLSDDRIAPADYDGDGKTDVAVWRSGSFAYLYILNSSNNTLRIEQFGQTGDDPSVVGDYDGDGKADPAVYRNAAAGQQSYFYYRGSLNNPNGNTTYVPWGTGGDVAARGDFNGDGRLDPTVFRPSNGTWYSLILANNATTTKQWGLSTDRLVPADYDADGKTDFAVFRNGVWHISQSSSGIVQSVNWGLATDKLVPADYDGDGRADAAVYRDGVWHIQQTTAGSRTVSFGSATDLPTPAAYLP